MYTFVYMRMRLKFLIDNEKEIKANMLNIWYYIRTTLEVNGTNIQLTIFICMNI